MMRYGDTLLAALALLAAFRIPGAAVSEAW
jgi:hypothetical protein